jgi:tagaturonate reductase
LKQTAKLPGCLTFSFAALLAFYTCQRQADGTYAGFRPGGGTYPVQDDLRVLEFFAASSGKPAGEYVQLAASHISLWGRDLALIPMFVQKATRYLENIRSLGPRSAMDELLKE